MVNTTQNLCINKLLTYWGTEEEEKQKQLIAMIYNKKIILENVKK